VLFAAVCVFEMDMLLANVMRRQLINSGFGEDQHMRDGNAAGDLLVRLHLKAQDLDADAPLQGSPQSLQK